MKTGMLLFLMIIALSAHGNQISKSDLLDQLKKELSQKDTTMVPIETLIPEKIRRNNMGQKVLEKQPNHEKVLYVLEKLMYCKGDHIFEELLEIYDNHIKWFYSQWGDIYEKNPYPPDIVLEQYSILTGFEHTLTSIWFRERKFSSKDIFDYYIQEMLLNREMLKNISDRCKLYKNYNRFSEIYRELNACSVFHGNIQYHYLDPYEKDLEDYFIDYLCKCNWESHQYNNPDNCQIIRSSKKVFKKIKSEKILNYFKKSLDSWNKVGRISFIYEYVSENHDDTLSKLLIENFIESDHGSQNPIRKPIYFKYLIKNQSSKELFFQELNSLALSKPDKALKLSKYIDNTVIEDYITIGKSKGIMVNGLLNLLSSKRSKD